MCLNLCWNLDARNVHNHVHIRQKNLKKWLFEAWAKRRNGIPGWNCPKKVIMGRCNASLTTITLKWLHKNQTGMRYRTLWFRQYLMWNSQSHVVLAVFVWKKGVKLPFLRGFCRICTWSCMFRASRFLHKFKHIITLHLTQTPPVFSETASNGHTSHFPEISNFSPEYRPFHRIF